MRKNQRNNRFFIQAAEEIIGILMERNPMLKTEEEKEREQMNFRFEIGKILFELQESLFKKDKDMLKIISAEIKRQMPNEKETSPSDLHSMTLFYKSSLRVLDLLQNAN